MGRMYSVQFSDVTLAAAAQDLFELLPATQKPIVLHSVVISQRSDVGDAQEEGVTLQIIRGYTASGSAGSSTTPVPLSPIDTASGATCETNNTTVATTGTPVILHSEAWNIRTPFVYLPTPEMRIRVANAELLVVRALSGPADALTVCGTLYFEEV